MISLGKPLIRPIFAMALAMLLVAGCSSNGDDDDDDSPEPTRTRRPAATETVEGGTPTPRSTPTPEGPGASRSNAVPLGTALEIAGWEFVVDSVTPDATALIAQESQFSDPPEPGRQYFMAHLTATYVGTDEESSEIFFAVSMGALGPSNVVYDSYEDYCGIIPDELNNSKEVFTGGTLEGNVCWSVTTEDADDMLMFIEPSFEEDDRRWFALN